jgi:hypothetical protein
MLTYADRCSVGKAIEAKAATQNKDSKVGEQCGEKQKPQKLVKLLRMLTYADVC